MSQESNEDDSRSQRVSEIREFVFCLNDELEKRLADLGLVENSIVRRVVSGQMSMNADKVPAYRLADRILARSLRLNVRLYQRNILYFSIRRRFVDKELRALGLSLEEIDREWWESRRALKANAVEQSVGPSDQQDQVDAPVASTADDLLAQAFADAASEESPQDDPADLLSEGLEAS